MESCKNMLKEVQNIPEQDLAFLGGYFVDVCAQKQWPTSGIFFAFNFWNYDLPFVKKEGNNNFRDDSVGIKK